MFGYKLTGAAAVAAKNVHLPPPLPRSPLAAGLFGRDAAAAASAVAGGGGGVLGGLGAGGMGRGGAQTWAAALENAPAAAAVAAPAAAVYGLTGMHAPLFTSPHPPRRPRPGGGAAGGGWPVAAVAAAAAPARSHSAPLPNGCAAGGGGTASGGGAFANGYGNGHKHEGGGGGGGGGTEGVLSGLDSVELLASLASRDGGLDTLLGHDGGGGGGGGGVGGGGGGGGWGPSSGQRQQGGQTRGQRDRGGDKAAAAAAAAAASQPAPDLAAMAVAVLALEPPPPHLQPAPPQPPLLLPLAAPSSMAAQASSWDCNDDEDDVGVGYGGGAAAVTGRDGRSQQLVSAVAAQSDLRLRRGLAPGADLQERMRDDCGVSEARWPCVEARHGARDAHADAVRAGSARLAIHGVHDVRLMCHVHAKCGDSRHFTCRPSPAPNVFRKRHAARPPQAIGAVAVQMYLGRSCWGPLGDPGAAARVPGRAAAHWLRLAARLPAAARRFVRLCFEERVRAGVWTWGYIHD